MLEKTFINYLENKSIKVISFDIFDTLVYRKTFEPKNVFKKIQQNYNKLHDSFESVRSLKEDIARQKFLKEDIHLKDIYSEFLDKEDIEKYINYELAEDEKLIFANFIIEGWIDLAKRYNKKIILTSDIYYSKKEILNILSKKIKNISKISEVYTSSDVGLLKSSSNLFKYILKKEEITPNEILHVGDNIFSDIIMANHLNIKNIYIGKSLHVKKIEKKESVLLNHDINYQALRTHATVFKPNKYQGNTLFDIGAYTFGPILFEFCYWLLEKTRKNNLTQINLLMREGQIFYKILQFIVEASKKYSHIQINKLYASRASLYFPYLNDTFDNKHLIYSQVTIQDYYKLHRIKIKDTLIYQNKNMILNHSKKHFIEDKSLYELIHNDFEKRKKEIKKQSISQSKKFLEYLKQINYTSNSILVDFGGGGSILEVISVLLKNNKPKKNLLFFRKRESFFKEVDFESFIPFTKSLDHINYAILKYAPLIEALFNGNYGTTIKYKKEKEKIIPVLGTGIKIGSAFEKGIMNFCETLKLFKFIDYTPSSDLISAQILFRFLCLPTKEEAKIIGSIKFEKNISGIAQKSFISKKHIKQIKKKKRFLKDIITNHNSWQRDYDCIWPNGVISILNETLLDRLYINNYNINLIDEYTNNIINTIKTKKLKSFSIYGKGDLFNKLYVKLFEMQEHTKINNIIITNKNQEETYFNIEVLSPKEAIQKGERYFIIASLTFTDEMTEVLMKLKKDYNHDLQIIIPQ